ncbi:MAG: aminotransferase class V-fold PLP-dependent enzyme [Candidatus Latescibacteria bacterium]|nr:aminotransferase class V-fold PLP-dependent enzyme [Candidatus Latescibacterota bacterium]
MKQAYASTLKAVLSRLYSHRTLHAGIVLAVLLGIVSIAGFMGCGEKTASYKPLITIPTYETLGLRPVINCSDYVTRLGGSIERPEVKMAMEEASKHFIPMADLIEAVGKRLGELTGAEFGCVSSGCAACMTAATCACVAGSDPEKIANLPYTEDMKNECIVAKNHRNGYDIAIRIVGVKLVEIETVEEMEAAINEKTAMIFVMGRSLDGERGPSIPLEEFVRVGKKHGVPVFVDASAERFDCPNAYIKAGVDLVAYSGGKHLEGPQCAGILLGREDLIRAAIKNIAPNLGFGRPMKVGKEEIMGVLAAAELWVKRDHDAEWKEMERMLNYIADQIKDIATVTTEIVQPQGRSNYYPRMVINWDKDTVKITPGELRKQMRAGDPSIDCGNTVIPPNMKTGEEIAVGRRFREILSAAL